MKKRLLKYAVLAFVFSLGFNHVGFSNALFSDQEVIAGHQVSTGCWVAPTVPEHVYPLDGYVATPGSAWLANPYMDWEDVTTSCPLSSGVQYQYRSWRDPGLTSLAYTSGWLNNSIIPAPGTPDGDYYWQIRATDGYSTSDWSSAWHLIVDRTAAAERDVVINEIMWMGSVGDSDDEWMELRNMTSFPVDLTDWTIDGAKSGLPGTLDLSGTIAANGYFLISRKASGASAILNSITPDMVVSGLSFVDGGEVLTLKNQYDQTIDVTPTGGWVFGIDGATRHSMERGAVLGDGTVAGSWHSCTDLVCNDNTYWDVHNGKNFGTPKALNHSDNDLTLILKEEELLDVKEKDEEGSEDEGDGEGGDGGGPDDGAGSDDGGDEITGNENEEGSDIKLEEDDGIDDEGEGDKGSNDDSGEGDVSDEEDSNEGEGESDE